MKSRAAVMARISAPDPQARARTGAGRRAATPSGSLSFSDKILIAFCIRTFLCDLARQGERVTHLSRSPLQRDMRECGQFLPENGQRR